MKKTKNINCSLGKDSCYLIITIEDANKKARDKGLPEPYPYNKVVFVDTLLEFDEMFYFRTKFEKYIRETYNPNFKIETHSNTEKDFEDWFFGKFTKGKFVGLNRGFPFFTQKNFCWIRREFKTKILDKINLNSEVVYIGIAKDKEHRQYRKQYDILRSKGVKVIFPLIEQSITEEICKDELRKIDMLNPLYDMGFTRLGCWLCPYQSVQSLFVLWARFPDKWRELKILESKSHQGFRLEPLYLYERLFIEDGFTPFDKKFLKSFNQKLKKLHQESLK